MTEALYTGLIAIALLLCIAGLGVPIAFAIGLVGAGGMYLTVGVTYTIITFQSLPYATASEYAFAVIPMFVLMGAIAAASGRANRMLPAASSIGARPSASLALLRIRGRLDGGATSETR